MQNQDMESKTVGQLVAEQPLRARVFDRFRIDFCCGGKMSLKDACARAGIGLDVIVPQLEESDRQVVESGNTGPAEIDVNSSLVELADHIEFTHHVYLKKELPRLQELAEKVARVHGQKEPRFIELLGVYSALKQEIDQHTLKEEMILFPYIRQLEKSSEPIYPPFGTVANPIHCMEAEHEHAGQALAKIRELTDDFNIPEHACGSWRALIGGLAHLDQDMRIHVHKENSILYPKAIEAEEKLRSTCKSRR